MYRLPQNSRRALLLLVVAAAFTCLYGVNTQIPGGGGAPAPATGGLSGGSGGAGAGGGGAPTPVGLRCSLSLSQVSSCPVCTNGVAQARDVLCGSTAQPANYTYTGTLTKGSSTRLNVLPVKLSDVTSKSRVQVKMVGTGNADLYLRFGGYPETGQPSASADSWSCRPKTPTSVEACDLQVCGHMGITLVAEEDSTVTVSVCYVPIEKCPCQHGTCTIDASAALACTCHSDSTNGYWAGTSCDKCAVNTFGTGCTKYCGVGSYDPGQKKCLCPDTGFTDDECKQCDAGRGMYGTGCNTRYPSTTQTLEHTFSVRSASFGAFKVMPYSAVKLKVTASQRQKNPLATKSNIKTFKIRITRDKVPGPVMPTSAKTRSFSLSATMYGYQYLTTYANGKALHLIGTDYIGIYTNVTASLLARKPSTINLVELATPSTTLNSIAAECIHGSCSHSYTSGSYYFPDTTDSNIAEGAFEMVLFPTSDQLSCGACYCGALGDCRRESITASTVAQWIEGTTLYTTTDGSTISAHSDVIYSNYRSSGDLGQTSCNSRWITKKVNPFPRAYCTPYFLAQTSSPTSTTLGTLYPTLSGVTLTGAATLENGVVLLFAGSAFYMSTSRIISGPYAVSTYFSGLSAPALLVASSYSTSVVEMEQFSITWTLQDSNGRQISSSDVVQYHEIQYVNGTTAPSYVTLLGSGGGSLSSGTVTLSDVAISHAGTWVVVFQHLDSFITGKTSSITVTSSKCNTTNSYSTTYGCEYDCLTDKTYQESDFCEVRVHNRENWFTVHMETDNILSVDMQFTRITDGYCNGHGLTTSIDPVTCYCSSDTSSGFWDSDTRCSSCASGWTGAECTTYSGKYETYTDTASLGPGLRNFYAVPVQRESPLSVSLATSSGDADLDVQYLTCPGMTSSRSSLPCNGHGQCRFNINDASTYCSCNPGYSGAACALPCCSSHGYCDLGGASNCTCFSDSVQGHWATTNTTVIKKAASDEAYLLTATDKVWTRHANATTLKGVSGSPLRVFFRFANMPTPTNTSILSAYIELTESVPVSAPAPKCQNPVTVYVYATAPWGANQSWAEFTTNTPCGQYSEVFGRMPCVPGATLSEGKCICNGNALCMSGTCAPTAYPNTGCGVVAADDLNCEDMVRDQVTSKCICHDNRLCETTGGMCYDRLTTLRYHWIDNELSTTRYPRWGPGTRFPDPIATFTQYGAPSNGTKRSIDISTWLKTAVSFVEPNTRMDLSFVLVSKTLSESDCIPVWNARHDVYTGPTLKLRSYPPPPTPQTMFGFATSAGAGLGLWVTHDSSTNPAVTRNLQSTWMIQDTLLPVAQQYMVAERPSDFVTVGNRVYFVRGHETNFIEHTKYGRDIYSWDGYSDPRRESTFSTKLPDHTHPELSYLCVFKGQIYYHVYFGTTASKMYVHNPIARTNLEVSLGSTLYSPGYMTAIKHGSAEYMVFIASPTGSADGVLNTLEAQFGVYIWDGTTLTTIEPPINYGTVDQYVYKSPAPGSTHADYFAYGVPHPGFVTNNGTLYYFWPQIGAPCPAATLCLVVKAFDFAPKAAAPRVVNTGVYDPWPTYYNYADRTKVRQTALPLVHGGHFRPRVVRDRLYYRCYDNADNTKPVVCYYDLVYGAAHNVHLPAGVTGGVTCNTYDMENLRMIFIVTDTGGSKIVSLRLDGSPRATLLSDAPGGTTSLYSIEYTKPYMYFIAKKGVGLYAMYTQKPTDLTTHELVSSSSVSWHLYNNVPAVQNTLEPPQIFHIDPLSDRSLTAPYRAWMETYFHHFVPAGTNLSAVPKCNDCVPGYYGTSCLSRCPISNGTICNGFRCDDGIFGTGTCNCEGKRSGSACEYIIDDSGVSTTVHDDVAVDTLSTASTSCASYTFSRRTAPTCGIESAITLEPVSDKRVVAFFRWTGISGAQSVSDVVKFARVTFTMDRAPATGTCTKARIGVYPVHNTTFRDWNVDRVTNPTINTSFMITSFFVDPSVSAGTQQVVDITSYYRSHYVRSELAIALLHIGGTCSASIRTKEYGQGSYLRSNTQTAAQLNIGYDNRQAVMGLSHHRKLMSIGLYRQPLQQHAHYYHQTHSTLAPSSTRFQRTHLGRSLLQRTFGQTAPMLYTFTPTTAVENYLFNTPICSRTAASGTDQCSLTTAFTTGWAVVRVMSVEKSSSYSISIGYSRPGKFLTTTTCYENIVDGFYLSPYCNKCKFRWEGQDCNTYTLASCTKATCPETQGTCVLDSDSNNLYFKCECKTGFGGLNCGVKCHPTETCSGHGACSEEGLCTCTGNFEGAACDTCKANHWGPQCSWYCGCRKGTCNPTTGVCTCPQSATEGFYALPKCERCSTGYFGDTCTATCNCNSNGQCTSDGACSCFRNYFGTTCTTFCDATSTCNNNGKCSTAGACICSASYSTGYWSGTTCNSCAYGYWGPKCTKDCDCNARGSCNRETGACTCIASSVNGFWSGAHCDTCATGYSGTSCTTSSSVTGYLSNFQSVSADSHTSLDSERVTTIPMGALYYMRNVPPAVGLEQTGIRDIMIASNGIRASDSATLAVQVFDRPAGSDVTTWRYSTTFNVIAKDQDEQYYGRAVVGIFSEGATTFFVLWDSFVSAIVRVEGDFRKQTSSAESLEKNGCKLSFGSSTSGFTVRSYAYHNASRRAYALVTDGSDWALVMVDTNSFPPTNNVPSVTLVLSSFVSFSHMHFDDGDSTTPVAYLFGVNVDGLHAVMKVFLPTPTIQTFRPVATVLMKFCLTRQCTGVRASTTIENSVMITMELASGFLMAVMNLRSLKLQITREYDNNLVAAGVGFVGYDNPSSQLFVVLGLDRPSRVYKFSYPAVSSELDLPLRYGKSFDSFEQIVGGFVDEDNRVLYLLANMTYTKIVMVNLYDVTAATPYVMDGRGGTIVSVTGVGFKDFGIAPQCKFGSLDFANGTYVSPTTIKCVAPALKTFSSCTTNALEISLHGTSRISASNVGIRHIDTPLIVSLLPSPVPNADAQNTHKNATWITVSGSGFFDSPYLKCKLDDIVTDAKYVSSVEVLCQQPIRPNASKTTVEVSLDGQMFSVSAIPFLLIGDPVNMTVTTAQAVYTSNLVVKMLDFVVTLFDSAWNKVGPFDVQKPLVDATVISPAGQRLNISGNFSRITEKGVVTFTNWTAFHPLAGEYEFRFEVPTSPWTTHKLFAQSTVTFLVGEPQTMEWVREPATFTNNRNPLTIQPQIKVTDIVGNLLTLTSFTIQALVVNNTHDLLKPSGSVVSDMKDSVVSFTDLTFTIDDVTYPEFAANLSGTVYRIEYAATGRQINSLYANLRYAQCSQRAVPTQVYSFSPSEVGVGTSTSSVLVTGWGEYLQTNYFDCQFKYSSAGWPTVDRLDTDGKPVGEIVPGEFVDSCTIRCAGIRALLSRRSYLEVNIYRDSRKSTLISTTLQNQIHMFVGTAKNLKVFTDILTPTTLGTNFDKVVSALNGLQNEKNDVVRQSLAYRNASTNACCYATALATNHMQNLKATLQTFLHTRFTVMIVDSANNFIGKHYYYEGSTPTVSISVTGPASRITGRTELSGDRTTKPLQNNEAEFTNIMLNTPRVDVVGSSQIYTLTFSTAGDALLNGLTDSFTITVVEGEIFDIAFVGDYSTTLTNLYSLEKTFAFVLRDVAQNPVSSAPGAIMQIAEIRETITGLPPTCYPPGSNESVQIKALGFDDCWNLTAAKGPSFSKGFATWSNFKLYADAGREYRIYFNLTTVTYSHIPLLESAVMTVNACPIDLGSNFISRIEPAEGSMQGGTTITVYGNFFSVASSPTFNSQTDVVCKLSTCRFLGTLFNSCTMYCPVPLSNEGCLDDDDVAGTSRHHRRRNKFLPKSTSGIIGVSGQPAFTLSTNGGRSFETSGIVYRMKGPPNHISANSTSSRLISSANTSLETIIIISHDASGNPLREDDIVDRNISVTCTVLKLHKYVLMTKGVAEFSWWVLTPPQGIYSFVAVEVSSAAPLSSPGNTANFYIAIRAGYPDRLVPMLSALSGAPGPGLEIANAAQQETSINFAVVDVSSNTISSNELLTLDTTLPPFRAMFTVVAIGPDASVKATDACQIRGTTDVALVDNLITFPLTFQIFNNVTCALTFEAQAPYNATVRTSTVYVRPSLCAADEYGKNYRINYVPSGSGSSCDSVPLCRENYECAKCSAGMTCNGTVITLAQTGYFREPNSYSLIECKATNCVGGFVEPQGDYSVQCNVGQTGPLCGACQDNYGLNGEFCSECASYAVNVIFIILAVVVILVVVFIMVATNLSNDEAKERSKLSVMIKMLLNHLQVASLAGEFKMRWGGLMKDLFKVQDQASGPSTDIVSVNCIFDVNAYMKFSAWMIIPVFVLTIPALVTLAISFSRKVMDRSKGRSLDEELEYQNNQYTTTDDEDRCQSTYHDQYDWSRLHAGWWEFEDCRFCRKCCILEHLFPREPPQKDGGCEIPSHKCCEGNINKHFNGDLLEEVTRRFQHRVLEDPTVADSHGLPVVSLAHLPKQLRGTSRVVRGERFLPLAPPDPVTLMRQQLVVEHNELMGRRQKKYGDHLFRDAQKEPPSGRYLSYEELQTMPYSDVYRFALDAKLRELKDDHHRRSGHTASTARRHSSFVSTRSASVAASDAATSVQHKENADVDLHSDSSSSPENDPNRVLLDCALCGKDFAVYHCSACGTSMCERCDLISHYANPDHRRSAVEIVQETAQILGTKKPIDPKTIYMVSVLVVIFLVYPSLMQEIASLMNCTETICTGKDSCHPYIEADMTVQCDDSDYSYYERLSLIFFFIYGFGIPFLGYYVLNFFKDRLHTKQVMAMFGFLFSGYRKSKFYWEMVTMVRKMLVVFIVVFLTKEPKVQTYAAMWTIAVFLFLNIFLRPWKYRVLWALENTSLLVISITLNLGLFYFEDEDYMK
eukprot:PhM_4_TR1341/c1_g1_i2/m.96537